MTPADQLRHAVGLAHALPGVSIELQASTGVRLTVAANMLDADLSPCQLRNIVLHPPAGRDMARAIVGADIVAGAIHVGGGIYQPTTPGRSHERWFISDLTPSAIQRHLYDASGGSIADDQFDVALRADSQLGITALGIHSRHPCVDPFVDEIAARALATVLVAELADSLIGSAR